MSRNLTESEYVLAIEVADEWSKDAKLTSIRSTYEDEIELKAKCFDKAYKAIIKTVTEVAPD